MATVQDVFAAMEAADAAGDKEKVRQLGAFLQELRGGVAQPKPTQTVGGNIKEAVKGVVPGAVGLLESAAVGASALLPEEYEKTTREAIASVAGAAKKPFAPKAGYEDSFGRKTGEALGSTLPFLAAGPLGWAGRAGVAAMGAGAGAGEARVRAEKDGANADQRSDATAWGILPGVSDLIPVGRVLGRLSEPVLSGGKAAVLRALKAGGEEGAQEAAQQWAQNLIAQKIYKPDQELIEGMGENAAYGASTGVLVQGILDMALGRRARGAQDTQKREELKAQQAEALKQQQFAAIDARKAAEEKAKQEALGAQQETTGPAQVAPIPQNPNYQAPQADLFSDQTAKPVEATQVDPVQRKAELSEQLRTLSASLEEQRAAVASAETPEASLQAAQRFKQFETALNAAKAEHGAIKLEKTPEEKLANAFTVWNKAKENGDVDAVLSAATKISELQAAGAVTPTVGVGKQLDITREAPLRDVRGAYSQADMANEIADKWEQAKAQRAKTEAEVAGIQNLAERAKQPSEAQTVKNLLALDAQGKPKTAPQYKQEELQGMAETEGAASDAKLEDATHKLTQTLVDPTAAGIDAQIEALEDARDQQRAAGREDLAATYQARIGALQSRQMVNPRNADAVATADALHAQLEQAKNDRDRAAAAKNTQGIEEALERANQISQQISNAQKEPGSIVGRLLAAKNDVSKYLTNFFDAAHEIHTANQVPNLREKIKELQLTLYDVNRAKPATAQEATEQAANRDKLKQQLQNANAQLAKMTTEAPPKTLEQEARQAVSKYVRAAFREENIRREGRNQPPLEGAAREAFAKQAQTHAEELLQRVKADRSADYMEERIIQPAQMRSGQVIRSAVTEWRDSRPLEERPLAKFSAARGVEEEAFGKERQSIQAQPQPKRVETGLLKRQWQASDAKQVAEDRGETTKTLPGQLKRRAEYLHDQLDNVEMAKGATSALRSALDQYPTNAVMDVIEPLVHEARIGRSPTATDMRRVAEAIALERSVAQDNTGQRSLVDEGDTRFERTTPQRFDNAPEVKKGRKAAEQAAREQHDTHSMLLREAARPRTPGEQSMDTYEAGLRRREEAVVAQEARAKLDAAVEERMRLDEMEQRLATLPHTRATREAEGAFAKLLAQGIRKEAAGLEAMLEAAKSVPQPDAAFISKLEKLLAKSNLAYEQIEGELPVNITRSETAQTAEAPTTAADDVLQPDSKWRRPSGAATKEAVSAAEKLEEKNKGRGRGPVTVPLVGPRRIRNSGQRRAPTFQTAVNEANKDAVERVQERIEKIEGLQELLAQRMEAATTRSEKTKLAKHDKILTEEHAKAVQALADIQDTKVEDKAAEEGAATDNLFRTTTTTGKGMKVEEVTRLANRVTEAWTNMPESEVVATEADLPQHIQDQAARDGVTGQIPGVYDPDTKKMWLVAGNLHTGKDVVLTVIHEAAGHYGMRDLLGKTYDTMMNRLYNGNADIRAEADKRMEANKNLTKEVAVEETLATMTETLEAKSGLPARIAQYFYAIKMAVKQFFGVGNVTDNEVKQLVANARRHVKRGEAKGVDAGGEATYRTSEADFGEYSDSPSAQEAKDSKDTRSWMQRVTDGLAMGLETGLSDMHAPIINALKAVGGHDAMQAMYAIRQTGASNAWVRNILATGVPKFSHDEKGFLGVTIDKNSPSAADALLMLQGIPAGNGAAKAALATDYMKAIRGLRVGPEKLGSSKEKLQETLDYVNQRPELKQALEAFRAKYNEYNTALVKFVEASGGITPEQAKEFLEHGDYIPFYRNNDGVLEISFGDSQFVKMGDIANTPFLHMLKGSDKQVLPINESIVYNTKLLTDIALVNFAKRNAAYAIRAAGAGLGKVDEKGIPTHMMPIHFGTAPKGTQYIEWGEAPNKAEIEAAAKPAKDRTDKEKAIVKNSGKRWMEIKTEGTVMEGIPAEVIGKSIEGFHALMPAYVRASARLNDFLRVNVMRTPVYILRQLLRDPIGASSTTGLKAGPLGAVLNTMKNYGKTFTSGGDNIQVLNERALVQSNLLTGDIDDMARILERFGDGTEPNVVRELLNAMDTAAHNADAATRLQIYNDGIAQGLSDVEASYRVMESMNFNKRGSWTTIQHMNRMIPFFNSSIQAMSVALKAMRGNMPFEEKLKVQRKFANNAMLLAMGGFAYAAMMHSDDDDDESYSKLKAVDRYGNFHIPVGNGNFIRVPVGYAESGGLAYALGQSLYDAMYNDNVDGEHIAKAMGRYALAATPGGGALPLPAGLKQAVEWATNTDLRTLTPIVPGAYSKRAAEDQYTPDTLETFKALGKATGTSPIKWQRTFDSLFANATTGVIQILENATRDESNIEKPTPTLDKLPYVKSFLQNTRSSEAKQEMYDYANTAQEAKKTFDDMKKEGRGDDAREFLEEHREEIALSAASAQFTRTMSDLNSKIRLISQLPKTSMTADQKAERIKQIEKTQTQISERYNAAIKAARKRLETTAS